MDTKKEQGGFIGRFQVGFQLSVELYKCPELSRVSIYRVCGVLLLARSPEKVRQGHHYVAYNGLLMGPQATMA